MAWSRLSFLIWAFILSSLSASAIDQTYYDKLQTELLLAQPGDIITIPEGEWEMPGTLSLMVDGVTIRGEGSSQSQLSFNHQQSGAQGIKILANDVVIEGLALKNPKGDGIKISHAFNITIRDVRVIWERNKGFEGAYGLYPVQTQNILIENSSISGASDAGIYLGQSEQAIIRRNNVSQNVVGIEVENSESVDVYDNVAQENSGGILVVNLPNLMRTGSKVRVYNNIIKNNNTKNFADPGTFVADVPQGTGLMISAIEKIEVFANQFIHNQTAHVIIMNYKITNRAIKDENYNPEPNHIYLYDNAYVEGGEDPQGGASPTTVTVIESLKQLIGVPFPDIIYDGPDHKDKSQQICVQEKFPLPTFIDLRIWVQEPVSHDITLYDCVKHQLPVVDLGR